MLKELRVKTPIGDIIVYNKGGDINEFPGVYIELETLKGKREFIGCVEYESAYNYLQTCTYQPNKDEQESITIYNFNDER